MQEGADNVWNENVINDNWMKPGLTASGRYKEVKEAPANRDGHVLRRSERVDFQHRTDVWARQKTFRLGA
jgi:hypothetical protein